MLSRATGLVVSIAFANSLVFAQGFTGTISGTVKDESDSVLQGAMVTAKHVETRLARTAVTDASGSYSIPSLPVGAYEITAQNPEFKVELRRGIDLAVVQEAVVNVTLQVGNVEQLIGGWQWNGIFTKQDGFPFTALVGSNTSRTGDTSSNSDVPNWNPKFRGPVTLGTTDHWFDPQAFQIPTYGTFGNVSRGSLLGPGLFDVDTSLFKKFRINERFNLQFRSEAFNILNHTNFSYPNPIVFSAGQVSSAAFNITSPNGTSRQLQLALKTALLIGVFTTFGGMS